MTASERLPVTVAVPTIGRPRLLRGLLGSLREADPRPTEVLVVDQSLDASTREVVEGFPDLPARAVSQSPPGIGAARNRGLREAVHDLVLFTDDDCTVAADWVGRAFAHLRDHPGGMVTGRVLASGDPAATPSVKDDPTPRDYTGRLRCCVLYSGNMGVDRRVALAIGGFDETLPAAEDNDLCYRWLRLGRPLRYEPDLVVWHHDWRTPGELAEVHLAYARAQGRFYAKHLRRGDLHILRFLGQDVATALGGAVASAVRRRPVLTPWRRGILAGLPRGLAEGWRHYGPAAGASPWSAAGGT